MFVGSGLLILEAHVRLSGVPSRSEVSTGLYGADFDNMEALLRPGDRVTLCTSDTDALFLRLFLLCITVILMAVIAYGARHKIRVYLARLFSSRTLARLGYLSILFSLWYAASITFYSVALAPFALFLLYIYNNVRAICSAVFPLNIIAAVILSIIVC